MQNIVSMFANKMLLLGNNSDACPLFWSDFMSGVILIMICYKCFYNMYLKYTFFKCTEL